MAAFPTTQQDDLTVSPVALKGSSPPLTWLSFEDAASASAKAGYAASRSLAGVMTWTVDMDDFG